MNAMAYIPPTQPLTERISIALKEVRQARARQDYSREWNWTRLMDNLLDRFIEGER